MTFFLTNHSILRYPSIIMIIISNPSITIIIVSISGRSSNLTCSRLPLRLKRSKAPSRHSTAFSPPRKKRLPYRNASSTRVLLLHPKTLFLLPIASSTQNYFHFQRLPLPTCTLPGNRRLQSPANKSFRTSRRLHHHHHQHHHYPKCRRRRRRRRKSPVK